MSLLDIIRKNDMKEKEVTMRSKHGDRIYMFTFYQLENVFGKRKICIFKETSHIHQLQQVKSQVEFRSVIMGCLTHELRTPVNCALSILKTLQDCIENNEEASKLLTICLGTIEMLRCLTEDFIDFTRFENQKGLPVKMETFSLQEILHEIENIFEFQAEEKDLIFKVNISNIVPQKIETDPKRLKQVLLNLLSNAFKFTKSGKIEITCDVQKGPASAERKFDTQNNIDLSKSIVNSELLNPNNLNAKRDLNLTHNSRTKNQHEISTLHTHLQISVIDTGVGMSEKDKKGLFTKFATSKNSKNMNTNGLGLGLYLSKEICRKLDGDLVCESMLGIGSTFTIKLPLNAKEGLNELLGEHKPKKPIKSKISTVLEMFDHDFDEYIGTS